MLQPSATRDRLGKVASNAIHQVRLVLEKGYRDVRDDDKKRGYPLLRKAVESEFVRIAEPFAEACAFLNALSKLDADEYREKSRDYRNSASHFLAPRIEQGHVFFVSRSRRPWTTMVQQVDGTYKQEVVPGKMGVAYGYCFKEPLLLSDL